MRLHCFPQGSVHEQATGTPGSERDIWHLTVAFSKQFGGIRHGAELQERLVDIHRVLCTRRKSAIGVQRQAVDRYVFQCFLDAIDHQLWRLDVLINLVDYTQPEHLVLRKPGQHVDTVRFWCSEF